MRKGIKSSKRLITQKDATVVEVSKYHIIEADLDDEGHQRAVRARWIAAS
jgi:hypothetical protein